MWVGLRLLLLSATLLTLGPARTMAESPRRLSKSEALRLADDEARRYAGSDLRRFEHSPVLYFAAEGHWYVGYRRPGRKFVDFGIDVYDKTRKASMILAPYATAVTRREVDSR
jgi:hypothetical protein